ncbi:uncharacterized protein LOC134255301 [Saccostrea cucullata]|uniref:uncharacterized protein LOC134255301 n=1 Tax=Saccostrea cuccullata TaxID=36930 RepID=UPI002ED3F286
MSITGGGPSRCCSGYRTIKDKCYPCNGSFGIECSNTCPAGYFGNKCEEKCFCDRCDARTGECYNETTSTNNSQKEKDEDRISIPWIATLLGLLGSIGSVAVLFSVLFLKEREKLLRRKARQDEHSGREDETNHELEEDDYASVRVSRMVLDDGACIGSFGLECSKPCPKGYYGLKCQEKCKCDRCNATTGKCFHEESSSRISEGSLALITLGGVFFLTALLTCLYIIREFCKKKLGTCIPDSFIESASEIRMEEILCHKCEQPSNNNCITGIFSETQV